MNDRLFWLGWALSHIASIYLLWTLYLVSTERNDCYKNEAVYMEHLDRWDTYLDSIDIYIDSLENEILSWQKIYQK